jgi:hypothetical protein
MRNAACRRLAGLVVGLLLPLCGCAHAPAPSDPPSPIEAEINVSPTDYKREILAAMHAYLNDPTGIRDASISEPAIKVVGNVRRYVVCLRFDAKKRGSDYAGTKDVAAVFMVGRFDHFVDKPKEQCADAVYSPFPELQRLSR